MVHSSALRRPYAVSSVVYMSSPLLLVVRIIIPLLPSFLSCPFLLQAEASMETVVVCISSSYLLQMRGRESPRGPLQACLKLVLYFTTGEKDQPTLLSEKHIRCHLRTQSQRTSLRLWPNSPRTATAYTTSAKSQTEKNSVKLQQPQALDSCSWVSSDFSLS